MRWLQRSQFDVGTKDMCSFCRANKRRSEVTYFSYVSNVFLICLKIPVINHPLLVASYTVALQSLYIFPARSIGHRGRKGLGWVHFRRGRPRIRGFHSYDKSSIYLERSSSTSVELSSTYESNNAKPVTLTISITY